MQTTQAVFLVRPAHFSYNDEAAETNAFQNKPGNTATVNTEALEEFNAFADKLRAHRVEVNVFDDTPYPIKPDAIFPNNWISLHDNGLAILYPMAVYNRRHELRGDIVQELQHTYQLERVLDLSKYEKDGRFLEGTGSIVFDRANKTAYACLSPRTDKGLLEEVCAELGYASVAFYAHDENGKEIYHTNVMMCIGSQFAAVCLDSITNLAERKNVVAQLENSGHEVIDITYAQMNRFAGNMLELKTATGEAVLALSQSAFDALNAAQKTAIERYCQLVPLPIPTIENIGGGSARCMIAEIFCSKR
tara:strand:+ start:3485 stop:4399 length:915 start_codon:yes stop_codon:yes gene_type:complete